MARYFFDIRDTTGLYRDEEGLEFADQRAAEIEAARSLGGRIKNVEPTDDLIDFVIEVRTEHGPAFKAAFIIRDESPNQ